MGLLLPDTRMAAAVCSLALMLAMFGANVYASRMADSHRLCWRSAIEVVSLAAAVTVAVGSS